MKRERMKRMERIESAMSACSGTTRSKRTGTMLSIVAILSAVREWVATGCLGTLTQRYEAALFERLAKYCQSQTFYRLCLPLS